MSDYAYNNMKKIAHIVSDKIVEKYGSITSECLVCGYKTILRFNVCKECDDAFWLTRMSKKHHRGSENHSIYDVKHIRKLIKLRLDKILELEKENEELKEEIDDLYDGKRGACFACEPVALLNIKLEKENKELKERLEYTEYNPRLGKL